MSYCVGHGPHPRSSELGLIADRSLSVSSKLVLVLRTTRLAEALFDGTDIVGYVTRH